MAKRKDDDGLGELRTFLDQWFEETGGTLSGMQPLGGLGGRAGAGINPNMAALLGGQSLPAGQGFIDPAVMARNPSYIPPHSGNVVQWLGGSMQPNKYENLLAGIAAGNNILTSLQLAKRQKKQQEAIAKLSPEEAEQLMFWSLLQGGFGGGQ